MTKDEHLKELAGEKKTVEGRGGSDAWFHFDDLYDGEGTEGTEEKPTFLSVVRRKRGT